MQSRKAILINHFLSPRLPLLAYESYFTHQWCDSWEEHSSFLLNTEQHAEWVRREEKKNNITALAQRKVQAERNTPSIILIGKVHHLSNSRKESPVFMFHANYAIDRSEVKRRTPGKICQKCCFHTSPSDISWSLKAVILMKAWKYRPHYHFITSAGLQEE